MTNLLLQCVFPWPQICKRNSNINEIPMNPIHAFANLEKRLHQRVFVMSGLPVPRRRAVPSISRVLTSRENACTRSREQATVIQFLFRLTCCSNHILTVLLLRLCSSCISRFVDARTGNERSVSRCYSYDAPNRPRYRWCPARGFYITNEEANLDAVAHEPVGGREPALLGVLRASC